MVMEEKLLDQLYLCQRIATARLLTISSRANNVGSTAASLIHMYKLVGILKI